MSTIPRITAVLAIVAGCAPSVGEPSPMHHHPVDGPADGPTQDSANACDAEAAGNPERALTNVVGCEMWKMVNENQWGDMHYDFHILRRWHMLGEGYRQELRGTLHDRGIADPDAYVRSIRQEGDPGSGIEFCVMHGAMIQHLREMYAPDTDRCYEYGASGGPIHDVARPCRSADPMTWNECDPYRFTDPACDYRYTLDGWRTDDQIRGAVTSAWGAESRQMRTLDAAIQALGNYQAFIDNAPAVDSDPQAYNTEDAWCLAAQTTLRLAALSGDSTGTAAPRYVTYSQPWGGIHNSLHGMFSAGTPLASDPGESAIDVGDPAANLKNRLFWALHGWIEAKWREARRHFELRANDPHGRGALVSDPHQRTVWGSDSCTPENEHFCRCGDAPGRLWGDDWEMALAEPEPYGFLDRTEVWTALDQACGAAYMREAGHFRNHLHVYGNDRLFDGDAAASEELRETGFFHGEPSGVESVSSHPSGPTGI